MTKSLLLLTTTLTEYPRVKNEKVPAITHATPTEYPRVKNEKVFATTLAATPIRSMLKSKMRKSFLITHYCSYKLLVSQKENYAVTYI